MQKKWLPYEPSIRVPLLVFDPRRSSSDGLAPTPMVLNIDIAPTLLDLAGLPILGWGDKPEAFEGYYDEKLRAAPFSPFQRSYAYVLAHGLDVVNADMGNLAHLRENVVAATASPSYIA